MKKSNIGLLFAFLVGMSAVAYAADAFLPRDKNGIRFENPSFIGMKHAMITGGTAPVNLFGSAALLYAVCPSGGTLGKYSLGFDLSSSVGVLKTQTAGLVTPQVWTDAGTTTAIDGCWEPRWPVQMQNGIVGIQDDENHVTHFYYRPLSGGKN